MTQPTEPTADEKTRKPMALWWIAITVLLAILLAVVFLFLGADFGAGVAVLWTTIGVIVDVSTRSSDAKNSSHPRRWELVRELSDAWKIAGLLLLSAAFFLKGFPGLIAIWSAS